MKYPHDLRLNRRQWLLATTAALAGCGGGGGNLASALPGTGGTGIGVQGPITGFGSVIVNGIKYDDSAASVYLDGAPISSTELRVGMVANIRGSLDASGISGSAARVDVWSVASGVVSQVNSAVSTFPMFSMIGVNGPTFSTDVATSVEGLADLSAILVGTPLTVWGVQTSADASTWRATRVKLLGQPPATTVSTGLYNAGPPMMLNGMQLSGSGLNGFANGQLLRVEGIFDSLANVLAVNKATPIAAAQQITSSALVELEGVVTAFTNATDFSIGTTPVNAINASVSPTGQMVSFNSSIEATGTMQNGVLIASKVELKSSNSRAQIDITGLISPFTSQSDFVVRGQKCDASVASVMSGQLANLHAGTKVRILGTSQGHETLLVQSIYIGVP